MIMDSEMLQNAGISQERIEEIFSIPKTKRLWEKIKNHPNYAELYYFYFDNEESKTKFDSYVKEALICRAMHMSGTREKFLYRAIRKYQRKYLSGLKHLTEADINEKRAEMYHVLQQING